MLISILTASLIVLALAGFSDSQNLPSSIRGYKVHDENAQARKLGDNKRNNKGATVKVGPARVIDVGLAGVTLEAAAELSGVDQDGRVDFLMFKDVLVNGVPLSIYDYEHPFTLKKGVTVALPIPIRGTVSTIDAAKAAFREATANRKEWKVSGMVFVFGRFKKMGFTFKRVIPVQIELTIPNPLKDSTTASGTP